MVKLARRDIESGRPAWPDLRDLVPLVPENDWVWWVVEFDAIGELVPRLIDRVFGGCVNYAPVNSRITWSDVRSLAVGVEQTIDITLVATKVESDFDVEKILADDFSGCVFVLQIQDSSIVVLGVEEGNVQLDLVSKKFVDL